MASIHNPISDYKQSTTTAADGSFRLVNIPPNPYHLEVRASGFAVFSQDVTIRNSLPVQVKAALEIAGGETTVTVEASGADLLEVNPSDHVDADRAQLSKLPAIDPGAGLSQAITYSSGGVAADGNGSFHPLGDHAQVSFVIDGQPISDQQSKVFSTQIPVNAVQSMELITGSPDAEFGDKTSLVANVTTRSGLGTGRPFRQRRCPTDLSAPWEVPCGIGFGSAKVGNFLAVDGIRSGRFLDTPEFTPFHDIGNNETIFDHLDLSAQRAATPSPQPVRGAQLDSDSQRLRSVDAGPAPARGHLELRAGLPAHLQPPHPVDHQPVHPQGRVRLLRQPRPFRRHAGHPDSEPPTC